MDFKLFYLYILAIFCLIYINAEKYTNEYVIQINGGRERAERFADEHNLRYYGTVGTLNDYHLFEPIPSRNKREVDENDHIELQQRLESHQDVLWVKRQAVLVRRKRDYIVENNKPFIDPVDPMWKDTWYLNRNLKNKDLPDLNVTGAWLQGFTGRGSTVTFLDDGFERDHPDLEENYDPGCSTDINDKDNDPMPRYDITNENKHGTRCAGEVGAVANNDKCTVGVAFHAKVGGIRMLDGEVTDAVEAASLSFNKNYINIYSASWGPDDNGQVVDGPGPLSRKALLDGATEGRGGKGSIFVWASGNGGRFGDSCSCDGYVNSIYTLSINSVSEKGGKPWYSEDCTSTLAATYSSGSGEREGERNIFTTDIRKVCSSSHSGTSAAAPLAAGIIALTLEANPNLTWRDVIFLIVLSSRPRAIPSNKFFANKRGLLASNTYGFGLMDAGRMVELAKKWVNVPKMNTCSTKDSLNKPNTVINNVDSISSTLVTDACANTSNAVNFIEQVEVVVSIQSNYRGGIQVDLISPSGTRSTLLPTRPQDKSQDGFKSWAFMTVQLWGESAAGKWEILVKSSGGAHAQLSEFYINIYGTKEDPVNYEKKFGIIPSISCNAQCSTDQRPCGPTEYDCAICMYYTLLETDRKKCVLFCPMGYYTDEENKKCLACHTDCLECNGPSKTDCILCQSNLLHKVDTHECVSECSLNSGYYQNENNECLKCDEYCSKCSDESNNCIECKSTSTVDNKVVNIVKVGNTCFPEDERKCGSGYYLDKLSKECGLCDITCVECDGPLAENCVTCPANRKYLQDRTCVSKCSNAYFVNEASSKCFKCNTGCKECKTSSSFCLKCDDGYKYDEINHQCVMITLFNDKCHETCYECFGPNIDQCIICKPNLILHDGQCLKNAPTGFYKTNSKNSQGATYPIFSKCKESCYTCIDENTCTSCDGSSRLVNGDCKEPCNQYQFINEDGHCNQCQSPCLKCKNTSYCISCSNNKYYLDGSCYDVCPDKFYAIGSICAPCHPSCKTCTGPDEKSCLVCSQGFKYVDNKCLTNCLDGTYFDISIGMCASCDSTACEWCIETPTKCIKCPKPYVLDRKLFTCKTCCSRAIHGQLKGETCCNCPPNDQYTGYCSQEDETKIEEILNATIKFNSNKTNEGNINTIYNILYVTKTSIPIVTASVILIVISCLFFICSIRICRSAQKYNKGSTEYKPLMINENELEIDEDSQAYRDYDDDYELNNNDIKNFVGKVKPNRNSASFKTDRGRNGESVSLVA